MSEALTTDIYRQKATLSDAEVEQISSALAAEIGIESAKEKMAAARDAIVLVKRAISEGKKMNTTAFETASLESMHESWKQRRAVDSTATTEGIKERMVSLRDLPKDQEDAYLARLRSAIKHVETHIQKIPWHGDAFKKPLNEFLKGWEGREGYLGAMVCGSYGAGLQNKFSDIDVYVILSEKTDWKERGDKKFGDFLVEYNAHPIPYIRDLIEQDKKAGKRHCCRKVATGLILSDPTGQIRALQDDAKKQMLESLPRNSDPEWVEMSKYYMWDQIDNLRDMAERRDPGFAYAYFAGVVNIVDYFSKFLGAEVPRPVRAYQFFSSEDFRRSYSIDSFPDQPFAELVLECMKGAEISRVNTLTEYVTEKMGGLNIDGWTLQTPLAK
ncbi:MAG: nucleotidyltransferase domain-containing protein [Parcubacteria group bacterium Gr01-1014_8]|nr:MAG: nucleotidyltransferase domain-containing protein [Parcubacteria group bacterium Gr01-1014_8]